jgi:hypothetical protein
VVWRWCALPVHFQRGRLRLPWWEPTSSGEEEEFSEDIGMI